MKINKDCEFEANFCHHTTKSYKFKSETFLVYHEKIKIYNLTTKLNKSPKEVKQKSDTRKYDLVQMINTLIGFQNQPVIGIKCGNPKKKLTKSENILRMFMIAIKNGDVFRLVDSMVFENGISCLEIKLVSIKY